MTVVRDARDARLLHVPAQARSRARLERILETADAMLATDGAEALTMSALATRAEVPIGSIYHLFEDKDALVDTLALRYWSTFIDAVADVAATDAQQPLERPVVTIIEALADGMRAAPGFRALWYSDLRDQRLRDITRPMRAGFLASVAEVLAAHWPGFDEARREAVAQMVVLTGDGLVREAFRRDPDGDPQLITEAIAMIESYVELRLEATR